MCQCRVRLGWRGFSLFLSPRTSLDVHTHHAHTFPHAPLCPCRLVSRFLSVASLTFCLPCETYPVSVLFFPCVASFLGPVLSCPVRVCHLAVSVSDSVRSCEESDICASFRMFNGTPFRDLDSVFQKEHRCRVEEARSDTDVCMCLFLFVLHNFCNGFWCFSFWFSHFLPQNVKNVCSCSLHFL